MLEMLGAILHFRIRLRGVVFKQSYNFPLCVCVCIYVCMYVRMYLCMRVYPEVGYVRRTRRKLTAYYLYLHRLILFYIYYL
jgi:hypothetical protein